MKKVLIFDMQLLFFRCYTAVTLINEEGKECGGLHQSVVSLLSVIKKQQPDMVICIWDGKGGSLQRRSQFKGYKEGRKVPRKIYPSGIDEIDFDDNKRWESISWQIASLKEVISNMPFLQFDVENYEADDVIAFLVTQQFKNHEDVEVVIVTNDKDYLQLVDERVSVLRQHPKDKTLYNIKEMQKKYDGLYKNSFLFYRMFDGDGSDNISGIKGYGLKTFVKKFAFLKEVPHVNPLSMLEFMDEQVRLLDKPKKEIKDVDKDVLDFAKTVDKIYSFVDTNSGLNGRELLERNYNIMQLQRSIIDTQAKDHIDELVSNFNPEYSYMSLFMSLRKYNINKIYISEDQLSQIFNGIMYNTNNLLEEKYG